MAQRKIFLRLHLWVGLLAAVFLFIDGTTGGMIAWGEAAYNHFNAPGRRIEPPVYHIPLGPAALPLAGLVGGLEQSHPGFRVQVVKIPAKPGLAWSATLHSRALAGMIVWFDPQTGAPLGELVPQVRYAGLTKVVQWARRWHGNIVDGFALFLLACSGLILWWPRRIFAPRRPAGRARANFELHNVAGFYFSALLLVFAGTAMVMAAPRPWTALLRFVTHQPAPAKATTPGGKQDNRPPRLAARLNLDQAWQRAAEAVPGAVLTEVRPSNDGNGVVAFSYLRPDDPSRSTGFILVDPRNGRIQQPPDPQKFGSAERIVRYWAPRIHEGEIFGQVSLWISGCCGFAIAFLAVTGPAIWWFRRRRGGAAP